MNKRSLGDGGQTKTEAWHRYKSTKNFEAGDKPAVTWMSHKQYGSSEENSFQLRLIWHGKKYILPISKTINREMSFLSSKFVGKAIADFRFF